MTLPFEQEYVAPLSIDQLGHTGSRTISILQGDSADLVTIPSFFTQAWASITPEASVNGVVSNFISFTAESQNVIVEGAAVVELYWK